MRDNIEEFYLDNNSNNEEIKVIKGYNEIYLNTLEKLSIRSSLAFIDDHDFYLKNDKQNGKIIPIDPFDYETLQIVFDCDLQTNPNKIDLIDVVSGKKIDLKYAMNRFIVNVDPRRVVLDVNYFYNKVDLCETNRTMEVNT